MNDVTLSAPAQSEDPQPCGRPTPGRGGRRPSRRAKIVVPAVLAFAASLLAVGAEAEAAYASTPTVRVGTWNVRLTNSSAHIKAGTKDLTGHSDVFGLQEMGNETKRAAAGRGATGFAMSTDRTAVPILYRTSTYKLLGQGRRLAFAKGQRVEYSSQDHKTTSGPKWVTYVHLQKKSSGRTFYVINTHMIVGAYNSAADVQAHPRRVALYKKQMKTVTKLSDTFQARGATVFVTCDCNVNYSPSASPVKTMQAHDLYPSWREMTSAATHGKHRIDYVWSNATPSSQVTGTKHGSDHASLTVTYPRSS